MPNRDDVRDFIQQAEQAQPGLLREFWEWSHHNKKWWLTPIVVLMLLMSLFVFLSSTAVAPFIYTLF
jgi:hypothetical protein